MANNPFALFTLDEKAESFYDVLSVVKKRDAELAAIEAEKAALEVAWAEAIAEDQRRTRWAQRQLRRQQKYGKVYGQSRSDQNGSVQGRSSNGSVQGQSRPSSSNERNNNQVAEPRPISGSDNRNAAESTEPSKDAANGVSEEKAEEKAEVVEESEEEKKSRLKEERQAKKDARENERLRKEKEAKWKALQEEAAIEAKQITLKKYEEAVYSEKRKALEEKSKKLEERKVTLDQGFETMCLLERKEEDGLLVKLEPETEKLKSKLKKSDKVQKVNITEFLKDYVPKASRDIRISNGRGGGSGRGGGRGRGAAPNRQETNSGNGQAFNKNGPNKNGVRYQRPTPPKNTTPVEIVEEFPSLPKP